MSKDLDWRVPSVTALCLLLSLWRAAGAQEPGPEDTLRPLDAGARAQAEETPTGVLATEQDTAEVAVRLGRLDAKQQQWEEAATYFERAILLEPGHVEARLELAGVEFRRGRSRQAEEHLRAALEFEPSNVFGREFLATLLYLRNRPVEALYHWNLIGEPRIHTISYRGAIDLDEEQLASLFAWNEGEVLRKATVQQIQWSRRQLQLGPDFSWQLDPRPNGDWNLEVALPPRSVLSLRNAIWVENGFRALLNDEVAVEQHARNGTLFRGGGRWDAARRRLSASVSRPLTTDTPSRLQVGFSVRDERWWDRPSETAYTLQRTGLESEYQIVLPHRSAVSLLPLYRHQTLTFDQRDMERVENPHVLGLGLEWKQRVGLDAGETARLDWSVRGDSLAGWGERRQGAWQGAGAVKVTWQLDRSGRTILRPAAFLGAATGHLPLDRYVVLGVGQDAPLPLRGHPTTAAGRQGRGPMGRHYALANLELERRVSRLGILEIDGVAFNDIAMVCGRPFGASGPAWFNDAGAGLRVRMLGRTLVEGTVGYNPRTRSTSYWIGLPTLF